METHHFVLLALDAMGGEVHGKTLLYKRVYFVGRLSGYLSGLGYYAHYYGPYSDEVGEAIGLLRALGFLTEERLGYGAADARGFEITRTDYTLTADGRKLVSVIKQQHAQDAARIAEAWDAVRQAGAGLNYMQLSIAAKVMHILDERGAPLRPDEIVSIAGEFGWTISGADVERAQDFLMKLQSAGVLQMEATA